MAESKWYNSLEWSQEHYKLHRENITIPWPDDEYLGRVRYERYKERYKGYEYTAE
jgi:hypothetical protein